MPEVVAEAANTLKYYPTRAVVRRLHKLLHHADAQVREKANESFTDLRGQVLFSLRGSDRRVADHVRTWLRPVWEILEFREEELLPDEDECVSPHREQSAVAMGLAELLALLADPDASPLVLVDRLPENCWSAYTKEERGRLRPVLLTHPDQIVRDQEGRAFAAWQDAAGLLQLAQDVDFCVRKSALYYLGQLPPTPGIADIVWDHLGRADALGVHATQALSTFVRHADPETAARRLGALAGDPGQREGLRAAAVDHLAELGAANEVGQRTYLLREEPAVTWSLHLALLAATTHLGLAGPDVKHLSAVDNLEVQRAVARSRG